MEKEKVLEIEITKINDNWSCWFVKNMNKKILKKDFIKQFYRDDKNFHINVDEQKTEFEYWSQDGWSPEEPILYLDYCEVNTTPYLIKKENVQDLKTIVDLVNEIYGIPKRWRARPESRYYFIFSNGCIDEKFEFYDDIDNQRYELGNYFETEEEAQKIIDSHEWQDFWEKVRAGEIGG